MIKPLTPELSSHWSKDMIKNVEYENFTLIGEKKTDNIPRTSGKKLLSIIIIIDVRQFVYQLSNITKYGSSCSMCVVVKC